MKIEEKISNIIYDRCYPAILPNIKFVSVEDKNLIQITVFKGSTPPYYLKDKGSLQGTFIRVGSTNRLADETILAELERKKRNISFDSEIVTDSTSATLNIDSFKAIFNEKAKEKLTKQALQKMDLVKESNDEEHPTNAWYFFLMMKSVIQCFILQK